jgi:hypothetical protein
MRDNICEDLLSEMDKLMQTTVKASNLRTDGNFELFLARSVASLSKSCTKITKTR